MTTPSQRAAIVTGGSRGIGAAIARRLARDGIAVAINYASGRDAADALVAEIEAAGGHAIAVQADLADPATPSLLFDAAERAFGSVDILVNNAGVMGLGPLAEMTDAAFARQVSINFESVFRSLREAARRLRDGGRIVNFSSSVVGLYQPGYGVYAATKAAVEAMTHILAKELGGRRVTVNAVAPGPVETRLFMDGKSEQQVRAIAAMNPFGRLGQPDDIAGVVAFLAGPDSGWINGQIIRANGGVI
ncbi:SDR family oxidoreductase [Bradyrhizobium betae]|uniref:SDR family oxidoreductase n=1 Tax=Bradyrhizobium betae TaxID=244734 RepID=A0A5P6NYK4_9BRAD|nr:SDR family oxidoreductase [Bradyrhizobium betae]MCS3725558.1 3-oxoacyl-[acyl-carrier protein] reductase [Bradyrhizobium betae]QFI71161.1 SDR family oxidoreductase [Bradyrhizobium betae]